MNRPFVLDAWGALVAGVFGREKAWTSRASDKLETYRKFKSALTVQSIIVRNFSALAGLLGGLIGTLVLH